MVSKETHYLKPVIQSFEPPYRQEYGNILLEMESRNQVPRYIKLKVTSYAGFDYEPPKDFDELVGKLVIKKPEPMYSHSGFCVCD